MYIWPITPSTHKSYCLSVYYTDTPHYNTATLVYQYNIMKQLWWLARPVVTDSFDPHSSVSTASSCLHLETFNRQGPCSDRIRITNTLIWCSRHEIGNYFFSVSIFNTYGNVLFNDALNKFYLRLYGVRHMVKNHSDSEKGNPPDRLFFPISSKGSFICTIPQTG